MLYYPSGIFVTVTLDLYVADFWNDRIQLFGPGELNATTIVGNGASGTISLYRPRGVVLDADGYLFIVEEWNNRVVGSGPDGFRCIVGCAKIYGSASNELKGPYSLSFDSDGNMLVADSYNNRIQKFLLSSNLCSK